MIALGGALVLATACGERFTGIDDPPVAGDAGSSAASAGEKSSGGSDAGGGGKVSGGSAGRAGASATAGNGGGGKGGSGDPGTGGVLNLGGVPVAGSAGIGGGPEVVPIPEEGLELWLRADRGIVDNDGVVATWKDSSKHQRDATQTAINYRPTLVDGAVGKAAVVFDGEDDYLKLAPLDVDFAAGVSIFAVAFQKAAQECEGIFEASNGSEVDDLHLGSWKAASLYEVGVNYAHGVDSPIPFDQVGLLAAVHQPNGVVRLRRNSNGLIEGMFELPPLVTRSEVFIGHTLYNGCAPFSGAVAELLLYSRSVSEKELVEIEAYLQKKWGCCSE